MPGPSRFPSVCPGSRIGRPLILWGASCLCTGGQYFLSICLSHKQQIMSHYGSHCSSLDLAYNALLTQVAVTETLGSMHVSSTSSMKYCSIYIGSTCVGSAELDIFSCILCNIYPFEPHVWYEQCYFTQLMLTRAKEPRIKALNGLDLSFVHCVPRSRSFTQLLLNL